MDVKSLLQGMKHIELQTVSEDVIKADIIRQVVYRRADFISTGVKVVGVREFTGLDIKYQYPSEMDVAYPVAEGARAERGKITWTEFNISLQKAEGSFMITDEATLRGLDQIQYNTGVRRLGEAMAKAKDHEILDKLWTGAGVAHSVASGETVESTIATVISLILQAPGVTDADMRNISMIVPVDHYSKILKLKQIDGAWMTTAEWATRVYGIQVLVTKDTTLVGQNRALMLIRGEETAVHGVLRPPVGVPLVETKRIEGVGREYIVRQFFATKVVPDAADVKETKRIAAISTINNWA